MNTRNSFFAKLIAAVTLCLIMPFAFTSCGSSDSDDSPRGPKSYEYVWKLMNTTHPDGTPTATKQASLNAEASINASIVTAVKGIEVVNAMVTIDSLKQSFTIADTRVTVSSREKDYDNAVKGAFYTIVNHLKEMSGPLPSNAYLTVKRSNSVIISEPLK